MMGREPVLDTHGTAVQQQPRKRFWAGLIRSLLGVILVALLMWYGQINLQAVGQLINAPVVIATCATLAFLALPLVALRWSMLLNALGISIPFVKLFHIVSITTMLNVFFLGTFGGDTVRLIYAWRAVSHGRGRVAASVAADRIIALIGLITIALLFTVLNWSRMRSEPWLAALAIGVFVAFTTAAVVSCIVFITPAATDRLIKHLDYWPRLASLMVHLRSIALMLRNHPRTLLGCLAIAMLVQLLAVAGVLVIARALGIGQLTFVDYAFAVPLTVLVNTVPISPNGLGVGEAAFDQICRWLDPMAGYASYSSIFFAYRAVSTLTCLCGIVSYYCYRPAPIEGHPH